MKFEIYTNEDTVVLIADDEVIMITHYLAKVLDEVEKRTTVKREERKPGDPAKGSFGSLFNL